MKRTGFVLGLVVATAFAGATPAEAQVAWDAPLMVSPGSPLGWGIYLVDPAPGDGVGVVGTWRQGGPGFRIGLAEGPGDDIVAFGGVDLSGTLIENSDDFPLDVGWVVGGGVGFGDAVLLSFPAGISLGRAFMSEDVRFNPYVTPRVVLDAWLGDDDEVPEDEIELEFAVDLGIDVAFSPSWSIRFGATLGDREALAIGFSVR